MALKSTVYKAELQVADMDRHYYGDHALTLACHPSETEERLMVRLLAFALNAHSHLAFGRGLSDTDEPDLWRRDLTGVILDWIEVGQPESRVLLKACGRADRVRVYAYSASTLIWWKQTAPKVARARNLEAFAFDPEAVRAVAALANRNMRLQCTIQDGDMWLRDEVDAVAIPMQRLET